jgi:hypothetical protein
MKKTMSISYFGLFLIACTFYTAAQNKTPVAKISIPGVNITDDKGQCSVYKGNFIAGETVNFVGTGSSDPDGDPLTYTWYFDDGTPNSTSPTVSHKFTKEGTYYVKLTVDDGKPPVINSLLYNKTPATLGTLPTGWKVFATKDFEGSDGTASNPHSGTKALSGTMDRNGARVFWETQLGAGTKDVYLSYWEYLDSVGRMNTELFVARFYVPSPFQELIIDRFNNYFGQLNSKDCGYVMEPQGVYYHNYAIRPNLPVGFDSKWHQWEIRYRPNTTTCTGGCNNGILQLWRDGVSMMDSSNINLNGTADQITPGMKVEVGGDYSLNLWIKAINGVPVTKCPSQMPAAQTCDCAKMGAPDAIECNMSWQFNSNVCKTGGPFPIPVFKRYIDDVIILVPSN